MFPRFLFGPRKLAQEGAREKGQFAVPFPILSRPGLEKPAAYFSDFRLGQLSDSLLSHQIFMVSSFLNGFCANLCGVFSRVLLSAFPGVLLSVMCKSNSLPQLGRGAVPPV